MKNYFLKNRFQDYWRNIDKKKEYFQFVKSLIEYHYDRAYKKTRAENDSNIYKEIYLNKINLINIKRVIKESNYF